MTMFRRSMLITITLPGMWYTKSDYATAAYYCMKMEEVPQKSVKQGFLGPLPKCYNSTFIRYQTLIQSMVNLPKCYNSTFIGSQSVVNR